MVIDSAKVWRVIYLRFAVWEDFSRTQRKSFIQTWGWDSGSLGVGGWILSECHCVTVLNWHPHLSDTHICLNGLLTAVWGGFCPSRASQLPRSTLHRLTPSNVEGCRQKHLALACSVPESKRVCYLPFKFVTEHTSPGTWLLQTSTPLLKPSLESDNVPCQGSKARGTYWHLHPLRATGH